MIEQTIDLEPYILNDDNMLIYLKYLKYMIKHKSEKKIYIEQNPKAKKINSLFIPREEDTLFWCYYIISNGEGKYEMLNVRNSLLAKQFKINYVEKIRTNKQIIKTYKFDSTTNIESNLVNDNIINITSVLSLCAIEKINVIFIKNKTYFELLMNDTDPIYIIRETGTDYKYKYCKKYGYEIANDNLLENIRSTLYKIDSLNKPIKSLSAYKVQDLIDICNKLAIQITNIDAGKNKTKNELYESIIQYF